MCKGPVVAESLEHVDNGEKAHEGLRCGEQVRVWNEVKLESRQDEVTCGQVDHSRVLVLILRVM